MSDDSSNQSAQQGGGLRSKVLIGILVLGLVALAYDYTVARPAVDQAYDAITERSSETNARSTETFTNLDVRQLLGKEPSKTFDEANGDSVEVFSWRSGLPIKTHDLYAVYKRNGDEMLFYRHAKYKYEASGDVSTISESRVIEGVADVVAEEPEETNDNPVGGGGAGPGGGRGFDPEAMFTGNDEDGDGVLVGDEIPQRMQENLAEIDTDGDGGVSKEELLARFAAMRAETGGGGGPRGEGGRQGRPEMESDDDASSEPASEEESSEAAPEEEQDSKEEPAETAEES